MAQKTTSYIEIKNAIVCAKAIIFDVDGILIDSERHWERAHRKALATFGMPIGKAFYIHHGVSREPWDFYREAAAKNGKILTDRIFQMIKTKRLEIYQKLQKDEGVIPIPDAVKLVKSFTKIGTTLAVASQVHLEEVVFTLAKIGMLSYFPIIVAGGDFGLAKKPAPAVYRKTAELLDVKPVDCIAIEDSANGAAAAVAAGMICLVVPNEYTRSHQFPNGAIVTTFEEIISALPK